MNKQPAVWRDLFDPGWREREAERLRVFREKMAARQQDKPCGECHLQPGERCDVCGAEEAGEGKG